MASLGNPRSWAPYINTKDCSLGFCSLYCPQWCYTLYPPPPPPPFEFPHQNSTPNLSPLVIAIIGILASAFLLVSYYTLISKYCGNNTQSSSHPENHHNELEDTINHNPSLHEPWQVSHTCGLDEALIKSITICKYKKGDGLVGVAECSVCLSEFEDDESIRLLPKCSHAFHLPCIDTWLKSHSSCPLCRSPIFTFNASDSSLQLMHIPSQENHHQNENLGAARDNIIEQVVEEEIRESSSRVVKPALRAFSDLQGRHRVIEIREEGYEYDESSIRRSVSMDHSFQRGTAVANVVVPLPQHMNQVEEEECTEEAGPSKANYRRRVLNCVLSPSAMKRSFSSGRFSFSLSRNGRG